MINGTLRCDTREVHSASARERLKCIQTQKIRDREGEEPRDERNNRLEEANKKRSESEQSVAE